MTDPTDQDVRMPGLTDEQLVAEIRGATSMLEGWRAHHVHITILAVERGIPIAQIADAAGLTKNGVRYRVKLARLALEETSDA